MEHSNSVSSTSSNASAQNVYKILLLGDSNVGKTCIVQRFCDDSFVDGYISTIGIDFKQKMIKLDDDGQNIKLQLWDTAGQERFRALTTAYYRGAMGIIVVYDVTNLESFQHVSYWFKNIDENASPQVIKALVANKCDLDQSFRVVDRDQAKQIARRLDVPFYECSCKHNFNIQNLFLELCYRIRDQLEQNENMFQYDGQINSLDIIRRLEDQDRERRQSQLEYEQQNQQMGGYAAGHWKSCSSCVSNYYYSYYQQQSTNNQDPQNAQTNPKAITNSPNDTNNNIKNNDIHNS